MALSRAMARAWDYLWYAVSLTRRFVFISARLCAEMVYALCRLPFAPPDLRLRADCCVAATDASSEAGGNCQSVCLSDRSRGALSKELDGSRLPSGEEAAIILWFGGIGAARQAWDYLELTLACCISSAVDPVCKRVVGSRWPHVDAIGSIEHFNRRAAQRLRWKYPHTKPAARVGGFPSQDRPSLKSD